MKFGDGEFLRDTIPILGTLR